MIDYGLGNLLSVAKAFEALSSRTEVVVSNDAAQLERASHIVLPGVGNFRAGMAGLRELGIIGALEREVLGNRKPFLGICLGMQLLAEIGEEYGSEQGLGWVPGRVRALAANGLKLPHIGWQNIHQVGNCHLFDGVPAGRDFYFVHSFVLDCPDDFAVAYCDYGERFVAAIQVENVFATQFHPEKSRDVGLRILDNFVKGKKCLKSVWFLSCC